VDDKRVPDPRGVDDELSFHVEMQTRRFVAQGVAPDRAREMALRRVGDLQRVRDACRRIDLQEERAMTMQPGRVLAALRQDARDAWRALRRAPVFSAAAIATLAIAIGATSAMFSVFNAVLLSDLPYRHAGRLVMIWNSYGEPMPQAAISAAEFADFVDDPGRFDGFAALRPQPMNVTGRCASTSPACDPERLNVYVVSPGIFDLAGVLPAVGRPFAAADGAAGSERVVLLSHALWQRRYGLDAAIVGQFIDLGGAPARVVGVMPPGVRLPDEPLGFLQERADLWMAYQWQRSRADSRGNQVLAVIARVSEGQPPVAAQEDLDRRAARFRELFPDRYAGEARQWKLVAIPFREQIVGDVRTALAVLFSAVGLVLLIACANVANLLMARGTTRARELAVRAALGARRSRLVAQLLTETGLLTIAGTALGGVLALAGIRVLTRFDPGTVPRLAEATLDLRALLFSAALVVATTIVAGLGPALRQSRVAPLRAMDDGSTRGGGRSVASRRLRRALVAAEVALAMIVLVGAGLLIRSVAGLQRADIGIDPVRLLRFQITLPSSSAPTAAAVRDLHQRLLDRIAAVPGVSLVSAVNPLPMGGERWGGSFYIPGRVVPQGAPGPHAELASVAPGYFETAGIALVDGRTFTALDRADAPSVVIVDEDLAARYWPGERAIDKALDTDGRLPGDRATVVGVVRHVRNAGPAVAGEPQLYLPFLQAPQRTMTYVVRTAGDEATLMRAMAPAVANIDPKLAVARLEPMRDVVSRVFARDRFNALLLATFAGIALTLAVVGLYGVVGGLVAERSREIGIRIALGGRPRHVLRLVIGEGVAIALAGVAAGWAVAAALSHTIRGLVFGIAPTDAVTYASVAALLVGVAVAASVAPARRASRVDPSDALRS
jgi:predicted permease